MTKEQQFWDWFVRNDRRLFDFDPRNTVERESLFDELATELRRVHRDLVFEFGPNAPKREFVISAGGIKSAFPAVVSLTTAAPPLDRWKLIAFRPRRSPLAVQLGGKQVDPKDVQFSLLDCENVPGLYLFIPGYREEDKDLKQIGYLMLDEALGEYDVETRVGPIKMLSPEAATEEERFQWAELPSRFDAFASKLEGRSTRPS